MIEKREMKSRYTLLGEYDYHSPNYCGHSEEEDLEAEERAAEEKYESRREKERENS
jgi:hypothetical protein